jgi:hypothetical protein
VEARAPYGLVVSVRNVAVPVMPFTLMLPTASRLTMAFAVLALLGATVQFNPSVPVVVTGEPLTVKSDAGAVSPTLLTVPVALPGKV